MKKRKYYNWEHIKNIDRDHWIDGRLKSLPGLTVQEQLAPYREARWPIWYDGYQEGWREREELYTAFWCQDEEHSLHSAYLLGYRINGNVYFRLTEWRRDPKYIERYFPKNPELILWTDYTFRQKHRDWLDNSGMDYCLTGTLRRPNKDAKPILTPAEKATQEGIKFLQDLD